MADQPVSLDKRRKRLVARLALEKRQHRRTSMPLSGRWLAQNGWEYPCVVEDISPGGLCLKTKYPPRGGKHIILMLDGLGRIQGDIVREFTGGFAVSFRTTSRKRDKLGDELTWLINKDRLGMDDERRTRRSKRKSKIHVQTEDGLTFLALCTDVSMTGMAIESPEPIKAGERVQIGRLKGVVTRRLKDGFTVQFDPPSPRKKKATDTAPPAKIKDVDEDDGAQQEPQPDERANTTTQ